MTGHHGDHSPVGRPNHWQPTTLTLPNTVIGNAHASTDACPDPCAVSWLKCASGPPVHVNATVKALSNRRPLCPALVKHKLVVDMFWQDDPVVTANTPQVPHRLLQQVHH